MTDKQLAPCKLCGAEPVPDWYAMGELLVIKHPNLTQGHCVLSGMQLNADLWQKSMAHPARGEPGPRTEVDALMRKYHKFVCSIEPIFMSEGYFGLADNCNELIALQAALEGE